MKIKFNSGDDFPLNKSLKFHVMIIFIRSVFEEGAKLYPQVFQTPLCITYKNAAIQMFQKELTLLKQVYQKNVSFVIIGILKMLDLDLNHIFAINAMMF